MEQQTLLAAKIMLRTACLRAALASSNVSLKHASKNTTSCIYHKSRRISNIPTISSRSWMSTSAKKPAEKAAENAAATDALVLTPYQKVTATAQSGFYFGLLGLAGVCSYFIIKELMPSRMNPNSLFNEAADQCVSNPDIADRLGTPIRSYGRDHGGHREGRRNFIEHVELTDKTDGKKRLRIKFNLKGPHGHAFGFAEAKKGMPAGEWVYLMVQLSRTGEVIKLADNRQILQAESQGEQDALRQLLQGGSNGGSM